MNIEISLYQRKIELSGSDQSFAQAASSRDAMGKQFQKRLSGKLHSYSSAGVMTIASSTLAIMIRKYSEQLVCQPIEEINFWFDYRSGLFLEPGYPPLYYLRQKKKLQPNVSVVAALGEGVAGLVMQRVYLARKLARPIKDYPDIVMMEGNVAYLVEAKATTVSPSDVQNTLDKELLRMCSYASACRTLDKSSTPCGVLVGTALSGRNQYQTYITEIIV